MEKTYIKPINKLTQTDGGEGKLRRIELQHDKNALESPDSHVILLTSTSN